MSKVFMLVRHLRDILVLPGLVCVIVPLLIYKYTPDILPGFWTIKLFGFTLFVFGFGLFLWTISLFQIISQGTLAPWTHKKELVTTGPYKYIRNPMILGVAFILLSEGLLFRSINILVWAKIFLFINIVYIYFIEEPFLTKKFGSKYSDYKKDVGAWIPRNLF